MQLNETGPYRTRRRGAGFTTIELLIVVAIIGILAGLAAFAYLRFNRSLTLEANANELSQVILRARSAALTEGRAMRVVVESAQRYSWQFDDEGEWEVRSSTTLPSSMAIVAPPPGSSVTFTTRGYANFDPPGFQLDIASESGTKSVVPSMTGNTRVR